MVCSQTLRKCPCAAKQPSTSSYKRLTAVDHWPQELEQMICSAAGTRLDRELCCQGHLKPDSKAGCCVSGVGFQCGPVLLPVSTDAIEGDACMQLRAMCRLQSNLHRYMRILHKAPHCQFELPATSACRWQACTDLRHLSNSAASSGLLIPITGAAPQGGGQGSLRMAGLF